MHKIKDKSAQNSYEGSSRRPTTAAASRTYLPHELVQVWGGLLSRIEQQEYVA